ncbi:spermidine synthase [uncultured Sphingomonas sp.]|uniref:spermidine synthase n=1 Tax=uncultured Sphingomonas sp. TaxID=158754 RepID=UPI0035CB61AD
MEAELTQDLALRDEAQSDGADALDELIDTAPVGNGGHLRLLRRGAAYSIQLGDDELMGSEAAESEQALAHLTINRMRKQRDRVLIGGLGMGFTLRAALAELPSNTAIVVAEVVPKVLGWARGPLAHLFGDALDDPRLTIEVGDVHDVIIASPGGFDGIMLDVDNGPDGFIDVANDRLYCNWGLRASYTALRPGGVLAVWSAYDDPAFLARLNNAGFLAEEIKVNDPGREERGPYTIWIARRPDQERGAGLTAAEGHQV